MTNQPFHMTFPTREAKARLTMATPANADTIPKRMALAKSVHPDSDWMCDSLFMAWGHRLGLAAYEDEVKKALQQLNDHRARCTKEGAVNVDPYGFETRHIESVYQRAFSYLESRKESSRQFDDRYISACQQEDYFRRYPNRLHLVRK